MAQSLFNIKWRCKTQLLSWKCPECGSENDGALDKCSCGCIFGDEAIKENITRLSNDELMKIINIDFADNRKEAIDVAREELKKRKRDEAEKITLEKKREEERRELQRKKEEERKELEEYEKLKAQKIQKLKEKKQNPSNDKFVIEYTSYNQYENIGNDEAKREIVQEHINKKDLSSEHANRAYETTNSKPKLFFITTGSFLLLIISICSYFIFKTDSPETIYENNVRAAVFITTYDLLGNPVAQGSGFILAEDGVVTTNYHVIEDAASIEVETHDGAILQPEGVLYIDQDNDIALVKLKTKEEAKLYKVKIGDPSKLKVGEKIYTIGNPKSLKFSFSEGEVSQIREEDGTRLIQFTAPVSPGSSGGAVLNKKGKVVGISSAILPDGENLNFALPIDLIRDAVKSRHIIYTFPKINTSWQFVGKIEKHDPFFVTSDIFDVYYDPNSIVTISESRKGCWLKLLSNSTKRISFDEMDCNSNKMRSKAVFGIDDQNKMDVHSDFSKEQGWEEYSKGSPLEKVANTICSSQ